tara:strand:+ start:92 stop:724 length:633 start_codon:yes stop_codon:yes gene_type:complete
MPPFPYGDGAVMEMTITSYTTIVIGLEDTLYDVGAGLTSHVYGEVLLDYMVQTLGFANQAAAKVVRDLYGTRHRSTIKALMIAAAECAFPNCNTFYVESWKARLMEVDVAKFVKPNPALIEGLRRCPLRLVVASMAPRDYVIRVLEALEVREFFPDRWIFGYEDTQPHVPPDRAAYAAILDGLQAQAEHVVVADYWVPSLREARKKKLPI